LLSYVLHTEQLLCVVYGKSEERRGWGKDVGKADQVLLLNVLGLVLLSGLDELADESLLVLGRSLNGVDRGLLLGELESNDWGGNGGIGGEGQLSRR